MGIVRTGERMATPAYPVAALYESRFFLVALVLNKKLIGGQPPVRVCAAALQKCVNLIFRNKNRMFLPGKAVPCLKRSG